MGMAMMMIIIIPLKTFFLSSLQNAQSGLLSGWQQSVHSRNPGKSLPDFPEVYECVCVRVHVYVCTCLWMHVDMKTCRHVDGLPSVSDRKWLQGKAQGEAGLAASSWGVTITIRADDLGKNSLQCGRCSCILGEAFLQAIVDQ